MALVEFLAQLDALLADARGAFAAAADATALEAARVEFLGAKSGRLKAVQKGLGAVGGPDKPAAGKRFNEIKAAVETEFAAAQARVAAGATQSAASAPFDPTLPGKRVRLGHVHPLTQTIEELKDIMGRLGFTVAGGPEIEDEWHNFEALNIPASHPARDPLENFYLSTAQKTAGSAAPLLLRSQTSTVQIRVMESTPPPVRVIALGPRLSTRHGRRHPLSDVSPDRGAAGRSPRDDGRPEKRACGCSPAAFSAATCTSASGLRSSRSPSPASKST